MLEGTGTGCRQVGRDGRWARGQVGQMVQARAVGGGSQAQAKPSRRVSRVSIACLVDGARQTNHLNLFVFIVSNYICQLMSLYKNII